MLRVASLVALLGEAGIIDPKEIIISSIWLSKLSTVPMIWPVLDESSGETTHSILCVRSAATASILSSIWSVDGIEDIKSWTVSLPVLWGWLAVCVEPESLDVVESLDVLVVLAFCELCALCEEVSVMINQKRQKVKRYMIDSIDLRNNINSMSQSRAILCLTSDDCIL